MIEMIMVIVVVSFLGVLFFPQFLDFRSEAKDAVTRARLKELREAISGNSQAISSSRYSNPGFEQDIGSVPTSLTELTVIGAYSTYDPFSKTGWRGPYIDSSVDGWDEDAWGTAYDYNSGARTITSCGPDLSCGNGDDIQVSF